MRPPVQVHDARVVNLFRMQHDGAGTLHDLVVAVVAREHVGHAERDAAFAQAARFRAFRGLRRVRLHRPAGGFRHDRRHAPVRRIGDQRGAIVEVALDQPERVVVAGGDVERRRLVFLHILQHRFEDGVAERGVAVAGERSARSAPSELRLSCS
jgi:hypothetical protein